MIKPKLLLIATAISIATAVTAQIVTKPAASDMHPRTNDEKIADALRGGPPFVTEHATILDYPSTPGGEFTVLRKGTNQWTCLPGNPADAHNEPGCFDPVYLKFVQDSMAKRPSTIQTIGISYMYQGKWVPNESGTLTKGQEYHVGPHIMIVLPHDHQADLEMVNRDGSNGQPYTNQMSKDGDRYLVIPVSHWPEQ